MSYILCSSWENYEWDGLYPEAEACMNIAGYYGSFSECVDIYDNAWKNITALQEFAQYQAVSFISTKNLELLDAESYRTYDHVVVYFDRDMGQENINKILETLIAGNKDLEHYNMIYQYQYQIAYYLD